MKYSDISVLCLQCFSEFQVGHDYVTTFNQIWEKALLEIGRRFVLISTRFCRSTSDLLLISCPARRAGRKKAIAGGEGRECGEGGSEGEEEKM